MATATAKRPCAHNCYESGHPAGCDCACGGRNHGLGVQAREGGVVAAHPDGIIPGQPARAAAVGYDPQRARRYEVAWTEQGFRPATPEDLERLRSEHGHTFGNGYGHVHVAGNPASPLVARAINMNTGHDKRYYAATHEAQRAAAKYARIRKIHRRMSAFDHELEKRAAREDTAVALMLCRHAGLRPGSDERRSGRPDTPDTFGASNLRASHVTVKGDRVSLRFTGKSGKPISLDVEHKALARELRRRLRATAGPGDRLFQTDERKMREFVRDHLHPGATTKDLRTYHATHAARAAVKTVPKPETITAAKKLRMQIARQVAERLGNTPAMALKSYIDPDVWTGWPVAA